MSHAVRLQGKVTKERHGVRKDGDRRVGNWRRGEVALADELFAGQEIRLPARPGGVEHDRADLLARQPVAAGQFACRLRAGVRSIGLGLRLRSSLALPVP